MNILLYRSENFSFNTNKKIIKSTIKFLKTSERFIGPLFWPFYNKEYWMNVSHFKNYMYICMQHLNAILWLVSVLGFILFKCIYVDVCLRNVNQYYRKKRHFFSIAVKYGPEKFQIQTLFGRTKNILSQFSLDFFLY